MKMKKCKLLKFIHIFWEGHTNLRNLDLTFDGHYIGQKWGGDFAKFCGLLRIYELYRKKSEKCPKVGVQVCKVARSSGSAFFFFSFISSWSRHPIPFHEVFPLVETEWMCNLVKSLFLETVIRSDESDTDPDLFLTLVLILVGMSFFQRG